jgi:chemotaxis protein CheZ
VNAHINGGASAHVGTLSKLKEMVRALESGDEPLYELYMSQLVGMREQSLLGSVVKITRELHHAVKDINADDRLARVASSDIPDACQRLDYVVKMTEEAAHKTLDLVDHSKEQTDLIKKAMARVAAARVRVFASANAEVDVDNLLEAISSMEASVDTGTSHLRSNLSNLAQIQEYQDLTGQIIKRVIRVVRDVEGGLIVLLRSTGSALKAGHVSVPNEEKLEGPAVPGLSISSSQQDADALLAELGF